jgi:nitrate/TMAO reductase-like tetraheme cytochrome c subunit
LEKQISASAKSGRAKRILIPVVLLALVAFVGGHEMSTRYFQETTCGVCHEMKEPLRKWRESGTALHHNNCAGCHFDKGLAGWWALNQSAAKFLVVHFQRDPSQAIQPREEPLFLEEGKDPGYWTRVPNHRCFQCKDAKNHAEADQDRVHQKALKGVLAKPCIDCHNHEMRKGQKFYEKVLPGQEQAPQAAAP